MDTKTPATGEQKRDVETLSLRAQFQPASVNAEARTVDVTWTTGAAVLRRDWEIGSYYEELSLDPAHVRLDRLNNGAPFLPDHNGYRAADVLGVVVSGTARIVANEGRATVRFPTEGISASADQMFRLIKDGIVQNVSVGYRVNKFEKVEGGDASVPTFRATDWQPFEISAVAMGADDGAGFRNLPEVHNRAAAQETVAMADENKEAPQTPAVDVNAARKEAAKEARELVLNIQNVVKRANLDDSFAAKLIEENKTLDEARAAVLDEMFRRDQATPTDGKVRISVGDTEGDKFLRHVGAWLAIKSGQRDVLEKAEKAGKIAKFERDPGEFRGLSMVDLARECLERGGIKTRGMSKMDLIGKALTHRSPGYAASTDFPVLLETTVNKTLLAAYETTSDSWSRFCKVGSVGDFRTYNRYRVGSFGTLDSLNENGEFKNKAIPDGEKASISIGTKGNMIAISRKALINDDMGAFTGLAAAFGESAKNSIEADVYALLAQNSGAGPTQSDTNPFFYSGRGNTASANALSIAAIDADRALMARQKDPSSNKFLNLRPSILLVALEQGGLAREINDAQYDYSSNKLQQPNKVRGLFSDVIDTPQLTGTKRYLFSGNGALEVAFLDGNQTPYTETENGWRVDGVEMKVRLDYGVAAIDWRLAVYNAGA